MSDYISRQMAIDALCAVCGNDCDKSEFVYNAPQDEQVILCPEHYVVTTLPSVQLEQKTTHLISWWTECKCKHSIEHIPHCKCANCEVEYPPRIAQNIKYCAYCGARFEKQKIIY